MPHLARVPRSLRAATSYRCSCGIHSVGGRFFIRTAVESIVHFSVVRGSWHGHQNRIGTLLSNPVWCSVSTFVCVCVCVFWPLLSHVNPSSSARHQTLVLVLSCMKSESAGRRLLQSATTTDYRGAEKPRHMSHSSHESQSQSQYTQAHTHTDTTKLK
jgi:hypothetical protein